MTSPHKPTAAFWITVALVVVLVGYPLSFGPWCWLTSRSSEPMETPVRSSFYSPILWAWYRSPEPISDSIEWFANLGAARPVSVARYFTEAYVLLLY